MSRKNEQQNMTFRSVICDSIIASRKAGGVATDMMVLARKCKDVAEFLNNCLVEEQWAMSPEAGPMQVIDLAECWTQAKSDIKAAMNLGIDLNSQPSYHKMKAAKVQANKDKGVNQGRSKQPEQSPRDITTVEQALADGDVVDAKTTRLLPDDLVEMVSYLDGLSELGRRNAVKHFTQQAKQRYDEHMNTVRKSESMRRGAGRRTNTKQGHPSIADAFRAAAAG